MAEVNVTIGDVEFRIRTFSPFDALKIFGDLQKELLPALGSVLGAATMAEDGKELDQGALLEAIKTFSATLDGKSLETWAGRLINKDLITFDRSGRGMRKLEKAFYDDAFSDFAEILELLFEIIKVNFAGPLARWFGLSGSDLGEKLGSLLGSSSLSLKASS